MFYLGDHNDKTRDHQHFKNKEEIPDHVAPCPITFSVSPNNF